MVHTPSGFLLSVRLHGFFFIFPILDLEYLGNYWADFNVLGLLLILRCCANFMCQYLACMVILNFHTGNEKIRLKKSIFSENSFKKGLFCARVLHPPDYKLHFFYFVGATAKSIDTPGLGPGKIPSQKRMQKLNIYRNPLH